MTPRWPVVEFFVAGEPKTKGSTKAFVVKGRAVVTNMCAKAKPWQSRINYHASKTYTNDEPLRANVSVLFEFAVARPKAHYDSRGDLRRDAPSWCGKRPDLDKYTRLVCDALTGVVWHDDSQVVELTARKKYADAGPGVRVQVWGIADA